MGGDHAPAAIVEGAVLASRALGVHVQLVGRAADVSRELKRHGGSSLPIEVVDAPDVVAMDESPAKAIRKKHSSMVIGLEAVHQGRACGFVSAGNSGAVMACAMFTLKRLADLERPAIGTIIPTVSVGGLDGALRTHSACLLIDAGANVDCKPHHLRDFAVMGATYMKALFGKTSPTVGLLANGEEESKGNDLTQRTHELLKQLPVRYRGYVEGRDIFRGKTDVVVCDGFVGNAVLKSAEGLAEMIFGLIKEELGKSIFRKLMSAVPAAYLKQSLKKLDYAEYGGAPLLGVRGVTIIAHGSSSPKAICNAIRVASELARKDLVNQMASALGSATQS